MKLRCTACNFELNLPIKSLPQNARLYCPKCKGVLGLLDENQSTAQVLTNPEIAPSHIENQSSIGNQYLSVPIPPAVKDSVLGAGPQAPIQSSPPVQPESQQMFSEDIKPEFEIENREEDIHSKRQELFEKPSQVWYDSTAPSPPPPVVNVTPPPIPVVPPPIPMNAPPPIPVSSSAPASGYISASESIQIDSSLVVPDKPVPSPSDILDIHPPVVKEERIELATEPPISSSPMQNSSSEALPISDVTQKAETAEKKDVIILTHQPYQHKRLSITLPVIGLVVLASLTGFIYYQIVVSSSKSDIIKDLKSTPTLGTIPVINNSASEKSAALSSGAKDSSNPSKAKNVKTPIKAKRSALEHYKRGNQFFMETKYEQARDEYAMAIAADPNFGLAYRGLGTTYAKLGQPELAVKNYEKYIDLNPNATDAEQVKRIIKQYYGK